jgi:hypothetical protein
MSAQDLKSRLEAGEPATVLDVRGAKAWDSSNEKIRGAARVDPGHLQIDTRWPKDQLTVAY